MGTGKRNSLPSVRTPSTSNSRSLIFLACARAESFFGIAAILALPPGVRCHPSQGRIIGEYNDSGYNIFHDVPCLGCLGAPPGCGVVCGALRHSHGAAGTRLAAYSGGTHHLNFGADWIG